MHISKKTGVKILKYRGINVYAVTVDKTCTNIYEIIRSVCVSVFPGCTWNRLLTNTYACMYVCMCIYIY